MLAELVQIRFFSLNLKQLKEILKRIEMDEFITKAEALKELELKFQMSLCRLTKAGKIVANKVNAKVIYYSLYKSNKSA